MYSRRMRCRDGRWSLLFHPSKYLVRPKISGHQCFHSLSPKTTAKEYASHGSITRRHLLGSGFSGLVQSSLRSTQFIHAYSSEIQSKGQNKEDVEHCDAHARLGEQDQEEWLNNMKLSIERKRRESPFLTTGSRRIVPWEKINVSWATFPYHIHEKTKTLLTECAASNLRHNKFASSFGTGLTTSRGRILLQSIPDTELYRERLVKALAHDLQVPLLVLDSIILKAPYDIDDDLLPHHESDNDNDNANAKPWAQEIKAAVKNLIPSNLQQEWRKITRGSEISEPSGYYDKSGCQLRKGDRVKYIGPYIPVTANDMPLATGQRGEVYEVKGDQVALILDTNEDRASEVELESSTVDNRESPTYWTNVNNIERDRYAPPDDSYIVMEALCEVLHSKQALIVYLPEGSQWLHKSVPKVQEMFDRLSGPVVLISGENEAQSGTNSIRVYFPNCSQPFFMERPRRTNEQKTSENVVSIEPPKDENLLATFKKQLEEDRKLLISRRNLNELRKVLEEHQLTCVDLLQVDTDGVIFTKQKAEEVVGWAKNHYLSSCSLQLPHVKRGRLCLPQESLEIAISRLNGVEPVSSNAASQNFKNLATDDYEKKFISAVVPPGEIGVKFDDVGALEHVKNTLNELIILPMRRPELFTHGNLLRPCKGVLLFGPPGTGKTLMAKALATEAGANFISVSSENLTSKWYGDEEKLTKALFSFASKLAPVIIFVDEVDSLLGARGGASEHEATRKLKNEFMAAWDGLRSKENKRILILGATNRPFDLDTAVIRRMPRRIFVDLPDAENRMKILRIILKNENLDPDFQFDKLAKLTDGYSGSDLKDLCVAAAYRPVQEILDEEKRGGNNGTQFSLRPLTLDDFIHSKSKVSPSVSSDASNADELRKWNEMYGEGGNRTEPFRSSLGF